MDPRRLIAAGEQSPVREDDTPEEAKERVLEVMTRSVAELGSRPPELTTGRRTGRTSRQVMMERDRRLANVMSYFAHWLQSRGYVVELEGTADPVRSDIVATRGDTRLLVELRPAIDALRAYDALAIVARRPLGLERDRTERALALASGTTIEPAARQKLDVLGIAIYLVDPNVGTVTRVDPAIVEQEEDVLDRNAARFSSLRL
jgi:hypothetical protein